MAKDPYEGPTGLWAQNRSPRKINEKNDSYGIFKYINKRISKSPAQ